MMSRPMPGATSKVLKTQLLTAKAFAPYGEVIDRQQHTHFLINGGSTERYHQMACVDTGPEDGRAIISIFRKPVASHFPFRVEMMEQHPFGSQAFIPLKGKPFLILVAASAQAAEQGDLALFLSDGSQGINYAAGTWHHPLITLEDDDELLVVDRQGDRENCNEIQLPDSSDIWVPAILIQGASLPS